MEKRFRLQFYGIVQGVGFRWTAMNTANRYRLTGFVKNEWDGSVTCEVQGREEDIEQFVSTIKNGRFISVDNVDWKQLDVDPDERSFDVKF